MDSTKAGDRDPLDELLGVDRRAFEDEELTQVLSRSDPPPAGDDARALTEAEADAAAVAEAEALEDRIPTEEVVIHVDDGDGPHSEDGDRPTVPGEPAPFPAVVASRSPSDRPSAKEQAAERADSNPGVEDVREAMIGTLVDGRYRVLRLLGVGGIGLVYLCQHELLEKPVALKVLRPEYVLHEDLNERFLNEARAASAIKSPHIVDTLDVGTLPNGAPYFVMEYVEGETLAALLDREASLDLAKSLDIARQIADGLCAAHAAGVVHRDLKPENVFLSLRPDGGLMVRIFDFGIAKVARARKRLTYAGAVFGTPTYMSPEQARGEEVDQRADVYALGIMIFEMLSGAVPFDGEDPLAVMAQHVEKKPPALSSTSRVGVPEALEAIVACCLAKEPDARYPSASALLDELNAVPLDAPFARPPSGAPPRAAGKETLHAHVLSTPLPKRSKLGRVLWAGLGAAVIAGGLGWVALGGIGNWSPGAAGDALSGSRIGHVAATPATRTVAIPTKPPDETREVHFVLFPLDAHVFRGDEDLGAMPVSIRVKLGQPVALTVRRRGFTTRRLVVDGSETRVVVGLVKQSDGHVAPKPAKRPGTPSAYPSPRVGGSG